MVCLWFLARVSRHLFMSPQEKPHKTMDLRGAIQLQGMVGPFQAPEPTGEVLTGNLKCGKLSEAKKARWSLHYSNRPYQRKNHAL